MSVLTYLSASHQNAAHPFTATVSFSFKLNQWIGGNQFSVFWCTRRTHQAEAEFALDNLIQLVKALWRQIKVEHCSAPAFWHASPMLRVCCAVFARQIFYLALTEILKN
jgi:hypothetical protein